VSSLLERARGTVWTGDTAHVTPRQQPMAEANGPEVVARPQERIAATPPDEAVPTVERHLVPIAQPDTHGTVRYTHDWSEHIAVTPPPSLRGCVETTQVHRDSDTQDGGSRAHDLE
jgi:hypothetical protein